MNIKNCLSGFVCGAAKRRSRFSPWCYLYIIIAASVFTCTSTAEMERIILDGFCDEWDTIAPIWVDPIGDGGASGIDFANIRVAEDEDNIYIQFEVNTDLVLQEDNQLTLYINTDNDVQTGYFPGLHGAELSWCFGTRSGFFFRESDYVPIQWDDIWAVSLPAYSADRFEICIRREIRPDGINWLFPESEILLKVSDAAGGGDSAPNGFDYVSYTFSTGTLDPLPEISLDKTAAPRLLTYNVHFDDLFDSYNQPAFERIFEAMDPDIIAFQEIYNHSAAQTESVISSWLAGSWSSVQISDKVLVSRYPITGSWSIADGRAGAFLIEQPTGLADDLLVINAHLSCCTNDEGRQDQADAIIAFIADAKTVGGEIDLGPTNPIVICGDMNFVGSSQQLTTLLTGDIVDEAFYGPDINPDWDETELIDLVSRHLTYPVAYTWYKEWSEWWPSRLDFIIYSDSNVQIENSGVLQTEFMPSALLSSLGLNSGDSERASDHLPHFADLAPRDQGVEDVPPLESRLRLRMSGENPVLGRAQMILDILPQNTGSSGFSETTVAVHDASGRVIKLLVQDRLSPGRHNLTWDGRDDSGQQAPAGIYWINCLALGEKTGARVVLIR